MAKVIWVNEQFDSSGLLRACIACESEEQAKACNESFLDDLTEAQRAEGWTVNLRTVSTWDEVPVSALKLSF
jgi:hypothetical protein